MTRISVPDFAQPICESSEVLPLSVSKMKDVFEDIYVGSKHCNLMHSAAQDEIQCRKAMDQIIFPPKRHEYFVRITLWNKSI